MSGIVGLWQKESLSSESTLHSMLHKISHRGPDTSDYWGKNQISLGSCLLRTTPESIHEEAITRDTSGRYAIVWDGRLDNREELQNDLGNALSLSAPDPEWVLASYQKWGTAAFSKLIGDFAFAIWDDQTKTLICVRDVIGLKPFHYYWNGQTFAFASEAKGLFPILQANPESDPEMLLTFLAFRNFKSEHNHCSFYKNIKRLPPAHYLTLCSGSMKIERYWDFNLSTQLKFKTHEDYADAFRSIFQTAVQARVRSSRPAAVYLSGGLDSSAVAAAAANTGLQAVNFYSEDPKTDEREYAREAAREAGIPIHMLFCRTNNFENGLDEFLAQAEAPMINTSRNLEPYQFLQERDWRVVLSGEGGDQVIDEFGFASDLLARLKLSGFFSKTAAFSADFGDKNSDFIRESITRLIPESVLTLLRRVRGNMPPRWLRRETVEKLGFTQKLRREERRSDFKSYSQMANYQEVTRPYAIMKLELDERIHAYHGLEPRYPFLDRRVIEFILSMPWQERANGQRKRLVREAMKGLVPDKILSRRDKADHTAETDRALTALCGRSVPENLQDRSGKMNDYISFTEAKKLTERYLGGQKDLRFEVWFLITTDHWLSNLSKGDKTYASKRSAEEAEIQLA